MPLLGNTVRKSPKDEREHQEMSLCTMSNDYC